MTDDKVQVTKGEQLEITDELLTAMKAEGYHNAVDLILSGDVNVYPGRNPLKPVLYWNTGPRKGKIAKGSGVSVFRDPSVEKENGRKSTGLKNTNAYKELLAKYFDDDRFHKLIQNLERATEGEEVKKKVTCDHCGESQVVVMYNKPDSNALKLAFEQLMGRAAQTTDINVKTASLYQIIDERVSAPTITVWEDADDADERKLLVESIDD